MITKRTMGYGSQPPGPSGAPPGPPPMQPAGGPPKRSLQTGPPMGQKPMAPMPTPLPPPGPGNMQSPQAAVNPQNQGIYTGMPDQQQQPDIMGLLQALQQRRQI